MAKYDALGAYLRKAAIDRMVTLRFEEVSSLVGGLPESAYRHRAWWANEVEGHVQATAWMKAGWKVEDVNLNRRVVTFIRDWH